MIIFSLQVQSNKRQVRSIIIPNSTGWKGWSPIPREARLHLSYVVYVTLAVVLARYAFRWDDVAQTLLTIELLGDFDRRYDFHAQLVFSNLGGSHSLSN